MPVIADIDEPPAKCCKYCEESTHGVDGPASWRLTLDQDLIDTLKGSFPSWFQSTTTTTASNSAASTTTTTLITTPTHNIINNHSNCATQITIDTSSNHHQHHHHHHHHILNHHNRLHHQNNNTLHHLNGNSLLSSSASPASSIASISSTASKKSSSSCSSSSSSSSSSCSSSSSSSSSSTSSSSSSSLSSCNNNNNNSKNNNNNNISINNIKNNSNHTNNKNHNNNNSNNNNNNNSNSNKTIRILNKSAKSKTASAIIKTTKASISPIFSSSSSHSLGGGSSLLATFSSPTSATVELISDSSCNGLLTTTTTRLSGKHFAQTFQDVILLHEAYDDMSEGEQCLNASVLGSSDDGTNSDSYDPRQSPPKAIVDSSPLQPAMDKNKESLKVKLMVRRPHSQLVEQGIIPPLKTSPAIHEQCKQLERAKTSDLLKAKIQQRPNREDLERLHILEEDECHIDPSLAEKQRMLKKARLADQLNSQIQHRPGPLELIKKNILHTEKPIEKIVKEGLVSFKATSEGLLTRPQHPSKYITFEDDSQSSESDTRQTPPRSEENALPASGGDMLQAAAASAGIVTVALTIPTSGGQVVVSSPPLLQTTKTFQSTNTTILQPYVPPPPPLPPSTITPVTTRHSQPNAIQVKQETANLFEELCQSVAGPNAQSPCHGLGNFLPMIPSPLSLGSTTSTLSPLSSVASPTQSLTPRPPPIQSPALQLHVIGAPKSDAPGKDKNRKKSKSKPVSKARTIKFHEYKGPPSAAAKLSSESSVEETSYQLMLEQQNCLLKFLETLNKNQSIIPAAGTASGSVTGAGSAKTVQSTNNGGAGFSSNTTVVPPLSSPAPAMLMTSDGSSNTSSSGGSTFSIITTPRPPPIPSPALSISSSIPPSPATSYAESTCSLSDLTRLEKMKVSDLKMQLKRRNLPVSGPKPQLIERLKPYLPLESMDCASSNVTITSVSTPVSTFSTEVTINATTCPGDAAMEANSSTVPDTPMAMIVNSPRPVEAMDEEQMDIVQQVDSPLPVSLQTVVQQQPQTATIMLSNEDLLREQQRKIDELQRQLQRSQQELQQIRQKQHHQQQHHHQQQQTVTAQLVNAVPTQQITLITTTTAAPQQTLTVLPQQIKKETTTVPTKARQSKSNVTAASVPATNSTAVTGTMTQKMVVKQQLEAKIQKQKQAAAAAAAAQAQVKAQAQAQAQAKAQAQAFAQAQAQAMVQAQPQIRLLTQKTQTVLIPTTTTPYATTVAKIDDPKPTRQKNSHAHTTTATTNTSTIITNQIPLTAKTNTTHHHNNLGLVWNEGNQTIFLVGLNDQHMTAHTIGNISLAGASPATKKLLNGHQRTSSLPSIVFPIRTTTPMHENLIETKPIITQQQFQQLQQQQQQQIHHPQQLIQLDIKPTGLPPPPPPPPQYEEATKQLAAKSHKSVASNLHMPNIKIKEEPNLITTSTQTISKVSNKSKAVIKSEKLTDVLDILIKQGELPESALEPITPVTPLTPGGSNSLMTDMSGNLIFSTDIAAGSGRLVPKLEPQANAEASPSHTSTVVLPMDITPSSQQQQASNDVFQLLSNANAATGRSITTSTSNFIENIDMASPLQPDCHIDAESVAKTLDIFLEQHHHSTPPSSVATPHHQSSPIHHHHDMLAKPASSSSPEKSSLNHSPDDEEKLHHFDEFELLELMSQQLEMDIGDDGNGFAGNGSNSGSCSSLQHNQYHHHVDKGCNSSPVILNGLKRDMNPSLQPSISDLIQQQLNHAGNNNSNSSPTHQISSANSEAAAEAAVLAATGGITDADFDFVDQLNQHQHHQQQHHHHHHEHQQLHHHHHQHNGNNNNHNILHNDGNGSSHDVDDDDVVSHFVSTPMDVCDDFDNPLGSFSFTSLSPDSNINTPPHPFGSGNSGVNGASNGSSTCGMAAVHAANSAQLHHNHHSQSMSEQMSICGTSGGTVSTDSTTDAFSSGDNILDLFNIDDYKMSWGEGDFAV